MSSAGNNSPKEIISKDQESTFNIVEESNAQLLATDVLSNSSQSDDLSRPGLGNSRN